MAEAFFVKRRLSEVKDAVRANAASTHEEGCDALIEGFIVDLVRSIARYHAQDPEAAQAYLWRELAYLAEVHADDAFDGTRWRNPFDLEDTAPMVCDTCRNRLPRPAAESAPSAVAAVPVRTFDWPVVETRPAGATGGFGDDFRSISALKVYGYTVGRTNGWPMARRQRFLRDFMELDLPSLVTREYGDEYGAPRSRVRLKKVADLIATLARNANRRNAVSMSDAVDDWQADLDFLKATYYDRPEMRFPRWPSISA